MSGNATPSDDWMEACEVVGTVVFRFDAPSAEATRSIAIEEPVQISYGGIPFAVMMMTPRNLDDFAVGFSLTEGVIVGVTDVRGVIVERQPSGTTLHIDLSGPMLHAHLARKRALSGRTSCGLCGIEDLAALPRAAQPSGAAPRISVAAVRRAIDTFAEHQPLNAETHAMHGAAWCDLSGTIKDAREDVGRHNALDKLIGALAKGSVQPAEGFVLISSRASFEMIEKVAAFGVRTLVAISAPTSLALARARALGLTLVGIARGDAITVFCGVETIDDQS